MTIVLLLLGSSVCVGLSHGVLEEDYGTAHRIKLNPNVHSIEFKSKYDSNVTVLWRRDDPATSYDSRRHVMGSYYVINYLTQRDSGRYTTRDKNQKALSTKTIEVKETKKSYTLNPDEKLRFTFDLQLNSCNIYFFPKSDHEHSNSRTQIVLQGRLQEGSDRLDCKGFQLQKPCGILNEAVQVSCSGRFEVRDQNDDKALEVELAIEKIHKDPLYTAIGVTAFVVALLGCCCVKCCSCGKGSSEKDTSETVAEPAVNYHECDSEPAGPGQDQFSVPSMSLYPAVASYTLTDPLVHDHPAVNMLPPYSGVSAPAEKQDAATVPLCSDNEPRFELKGMTFPSSLPLTSDSTLCHVYTSDKLNFK